MSSSASFDNGEMALVAVLSIADFLLLPGYNFPGQQAKHKYPTRSIQYHAFGGVVLLLSGLISIVCYHFDKALVLASIACKLQGALCSTAMGVVVIFTLSRYTKGRPGFNMAGYALYAMWMLSLGNKALFDPSPRNAWNVFVATHAYLSCRLFVTLFEAMLKWKGDLSYSTATNLAVGIPLCLLKGQSGWRLYSVITLIAVLSDLVGLRRAHAYRGKSFS